MRNCRCGERRSFYESPCKLIWYSGGRERSWTQILNILPLNQQNYNRTYIKTKTHSHAQPIASTKNLGTHHKHHKPEQQRKKLKFTLPFLPCLSIYLPLIIPLIITMPPSNFTLPSRQRTRQRAR